MNNMTEGSILKGVVRFAIPCIISNVLQNLYNIVDSVIVGKSDGTAALAAVGASGSLINLFLTTVTGFACGFAICAGKRYGAGDRKGLRGVFANGLLLVLAVSLMLSVLGAVFARDMLVIMNTPGEILEEATGYLLVIFFGMGFNLVYSYLCEMLRGIGNSKMPLYFLIASSILHLVLILVFLFGFSMGVVGAALSTVLSQAFAVAICWVYLFRRVPEYRISLRDLRPRREILAEGLRIGGPMAVTNFVVMFGVIILSFVTNGIGTEYVAAYSTASRVGYIVTTPLFGFASALSVFVAQNLGVGNLPRIREGVRKTLLFTTGVDTVLLVIFLFATRPLLSFLLNGEPVAVEAGTTYLLIRCFAMVVLAPAACLKNVLNSLGKTLFPTISGFCEVGIRYLVPIALSGRLGFVSVPLTDVAAWLFLAVFLEIGYIRESRSLTLITK
ncbi:MAG: MATE family efflux transporter [Clostridia bacterium]|nr:MATE family efflux transporter [Clostridia bacterium]